MQEIEKALGTDLDQALLTAIFQLSLKLKMLSQGNRTSFGCSVSPPSFHKKDRRNNHWPLQIRSVPEIFIRLTTGETNSSGKQSPAIMPVKPKRQTRWKLSNTLLGLSTSIQNIRDRTGPILSGTRNGWDGSPLFNARIKVLGRQVERQIWSKCYRYQSFDFMSDSYTQIWVPSTQDTVQSTPRKPSERARCNFKEVMNGIIASTH